MNRKLYYAFLVLIMVLGVTSPTLAQSAKMTVSGVVVAENGDPIIGATIVEQGTTNGVATGLKGDFTISVASSKSELEVSSMGYETQTVSIGSRTNISIRMKDEAHDINEVVVVGYGYVKKSDLTGSVTSIKSDDLTKTKSASFIESMQGRMAGVQVSSTSGEPGSGLSISIRGSSSINADTQPLYIIDGMQIEASSDEFASNSLGTTSTYDPLSSLNANDIESIEVLKDAASTAIYGSKGANGVVLITTKSGKTNSSTLSFDANFGVSTVLNTIEMANADEFVVYAYDHINSSTWGQDLDGNGTTDAPIDISNSETHNWSDEVYRAAISQSYNISYDVGSEKTNVSSSMGYLNQEGIVMNNVFERFTGRVKATHKASDRITIGTNVNASYQKSSGVTSSGGSGEFTGILQIISLYRPVNSSTDDETNAEDDSTSGMTNPLTFIEDAQRLNSYARVAGDAFATVKLSNNLTFRTQVNGILTNSKDQAWYPSTTSWGYNTNGKLTYATANSTSWQNSNTLTYNRRFNKNHYVNAMLGAEFSQYSLEKFGITATNFDINADMIDLIGYANTISTWPSTTHEESTRASLFGRINYTLKDKYLFTGTIRRDGSSKFGANNKYAYFPSMAVAWRLSQEPFIKEYDFVSNAKIRLSYGASGNDKIPSYQSVWRTEEASTSSTTGEAFGIAQTTLPNYDLKWETTHQYDAGLDLGFLNNRITLTADAYYKRTSDMLLNASVASQSGTYSQYQNVGQVDNKGLEIALTTVNVVATDFTWTTSFNINFNRNEVISLGDVDYLSVAITGTNITNVGRVIVGESIGTMWGYTFDGVYQSDDFESDGSLKEGVVSMNGATSSAGDSKFKDLNDDGTIDDNDKSVIGNSAPKHYGGITNSFSYKNLDFSFLFTWSYGNDILNVAKYKYEGFNSYNISKDYFYNYWSPTNASNTTPSPDDSNKSECSTYYVEDGSYIRLKNITIGWTLPPYGFLRASKIKYARVYAGIENLLTFTEYSGTDPEVSYNNALITGVDNQIYPRSRTFNFGLNVKF